MGASAAVIAAAAFLIRYLLRRLPKAYSFGPPQWVIMIAGAVVVVLGVGFAVSKTGGQNYYEGTALITPEPSASAAPSATSATASPTPTPSPSPAQTPPPSASVSPSPSPEPTETPILPEILAARTEYGNGDIVGYLDVPGTNIQYYITQAADNDFYMTHDISKRASNAGWLFLDYENDFTRQDKNTIIYGHNMKAKIMFHELRNFLNGDFARGNRYLRLMTLYGEQTYEIFAVFETDTNFYYNLVNIDDGQFGLILDTMNAKSLFDFGVEVHTGDRILTLSTCSNLPDDSRLVVAGKLIENDWATPGAD
ncbi:MAG: class B sortase [Firmicutes bacterium]|nr:class B sortase [Bacillota bacterium]